MLDIRAYETLTVLGSGQFGNVVLVRRSSDRKLFAAKIPHGDDSAAKQAGRQEAQLLMGLHHVNIVQFVELVEENSQLALVMEYASSGDLDAFLRWQQESTGCLSEPAVMRIFIQIVLALQYLHGQRILHRDLKPKNILLDGDGIVKLSDFGVSKMLQSSLDSAKTITGTPHYMAPELLEGESYDCKSDVWSLGCVLYELATFSPPFTGLALGAVVGLILHSDPAPIPHHYSSPFRALVTTLLQKDPSHRPSLPEILSCDVVQQHLMQLVSVATSHQPMLLEQFAEKHRDGESSPTQALKNSTAPLELVSPLPNLQSYRNDDARVNELPIPATARPSKTQPESDHARQIFFENQAAARRNKERIDQERSCAAVFLDCTDSASPGQHVHDKRQAPKSAPDARGSYGGSIVVSRREPPPAPSSAASSRTRAQSSPASYEELLQAERRRIQLETKALQERMRAMQTTDSNATSTIEE